MYVLLLVHLQSALIDMSIQVIWLVNKEGPQTCQDHMLQLPQTKLCSEFPVCHAEQ